ncbi:hypothetical protein BBJ28_00007139 [Nothophytophthora sp. Chile5]|nr:hypothetical protein BBJ28_00007139 [Nothophytophthora sp. Chile5]
MSPHFANPRNMNAAATFARGPSALELATGMAGAGEHYADLDSPTTPTTRSMQLRLRKQRSAGVASAAAAETSVMVIYASAPTVGGVVQQIWQIDLGVAIALLFNFAVFACVPITQDQLISVSENLSDTSYYVSLHDWGVVFPLIFAFTFVIFLSPMQHNVKKFAVMSNAFFSSNVGLHGTTVLKFIDPMSPEAGATHLKDLTNSYYATSGLMKNLAIYSVVGVVGTLISLATVLLPFPLFATKKLMHHVEHAPQDHRKILNLIMDSYCFRAKDIKKMDFFRLRLDRLLKEAQHRLAEMENLLEDCWWEELVGVGLFLQFNKTVAKQFVKLYACLLKDLRAMKFAIESETGHWTHVVLMKKMQQSFHVLQAEANDLLQDVAGKVLEASTTMPASKFDHLELALERLMDKYTKFYGELLSAEVHSADDVGKTMPLNVFVYSFHAFVHTLFQFEGQFNHKNFSASYRVKNFLRMTWTSVYRRASYPRQMVLFAVRTTLAVLIAYCASTFIFAFSSTAPTAIAMVAQFHVGGTYGNMMNRMAGLVAGTVVPSILHFFVCRTSNVALYNTLNNIVLFLWIVGSMYVCFSSPYLRMAGMVSAYMSASVLLDHSCRSATKILSYSSLTENSVAIIILMLVEASLQPQSARGLLRDNVQQLLQQYGQVFQRIFAHHIASNSATAPSVGDLPTVVESNSSSTVLPLTSMTEDEAKSLRHQLAVTLPAILKQQKKLLHDATAEPSLWKAKFSNEQYSQVMGVCWTLLDRLRLLSDLVEWREKTRMAGFQGGIRLKRRGAGSLNDECTAAFQQQEQQEKQQQPAAPASSITAAPEDGVAPESRPEPPLPPLNPEAPPAVAKLKWDHSQSAFESVVDESFDTLVTLFGNDFTYRTADDHAIFLQMKEAFRIADKDRNGTVDASELCVLLEKLMPYAGGQGDVHMEQYVDEFIRLVDKDHDGQITFHEFMQALNEGFRLELEIYENTTQLVAVGEATEHLSSGDRVRNPPVPTQETASSMENSDGSAVVDVLDCDEAIGYTAQSTPAALLSATAASSSDTHFLSASNLRSYLFGDSGGSSSLGSSRRQRRWAHNRAESAGVALLNVESFTLNEAAATLKQSYGELLLRALDDEDHQVTMEDFIVMSCLISACEDIAANLTRLNTLAAS